MSRIAQLAALAVFVFAAGCAAEGNYGNSVALTDSTAAGKADSISGKLLEPIFTGEEILALDSVYEGAVEVETVGDTILEVRGSRLVVPAGKNKKVRFEVDTDDWFTKIRFVVYVRPAGGDYLWETIEIDGNVTTIFGTSNQVTINFFDFIELDALLEELTFSAFGDAVSAPFTGVYNVDLEYSLMVFPESGWGSLDGTYEYTLTIDDATPR